VVQAVNRGGSHRPHELRVLAHRGRFIDTKIGYLDELQCPFSLQRAMQRTVEVAPPEISLVGGHLEGDGANFECRERQWQNEQPLIRREYYRIVFGLKRCAGERSDHRKAREVSAPSHEFFLPLTVTSA
jgi:hypothetical protein